MKQPLPFAPIPKNGAAAQRAYRKRLTDAGCKTINFTCYKKQMILLEAYKAKGYKKVDLINYAISLLPDKIKI